MRVQSGLFPKLRWGSLQLIFVVITYEKVSLWLYWKSLGNSGNFFSYFVALATLCQLLTEPVSSL